MSAVEGYRILVSATQNAKVPKAVSLLDYSGFRFSADLKSTPKRWADMQKAVRFAKDQWKTIEADVSDRTFKTNFSQTLAGMGKSVKSKSAASAHASVAEELDLVDKLESFFNKR